MMRKKPAGHKTAQRTSRNVLKRACKGGRRRLLGTGSAFAAAIALAALVASPAAAQSIPRNPAPIPGLDIPLPTEVGSPILRAGDRDASPVIGSNMPSVPMPIASNYYVDQRGLTLSTPTVPPPPSNTGQTGTPTPEPIVTPPNSGGSQIGFQPNVFAPVVVDASSTPAPSPGDTDTNGINVLASANYFNSDIDFSPGAAVDVVDVLTGEAIINWTTFTAGSVGSDVTFLGAGGNLEFTSALSDYTVLNRIFTPGIDSAVRIDGNVTSSVLSGASTGGNIWFYSPGGIIVGATGSFDVGGLMLTSSNINSIDSGGSQMNFTGVAETDTAVVIEAGATIDAGSYVAMVAPRVVQGGTVTVDGSAAYVGAEQAQLTINNGLFDITVGVGSEDANGVVHTGTTTGAASQAVIDGFGQISDADARGIYMVAVAKNDAINMLVGGDIGYQPAAAAARTSNGTIVLSAGANVSAGGSLDAPTIDIDEASATDGGSIEFQGGTLSSNLIAVASDTIDITPSFGETLSVGSDALEAYDMSLSAGNDLILGAGIGGVLSIDGDLNLRSGLDQATGGDVTISVAGNVPGPFDPVFANGQLIVGGNLTIDASGTGRDDFFTVRNNGGTGIGEAAAAGDISFSVTNNAVIDIGGSLVLDASAQGGKGESVNGASTAGSIQFTVDGGSLDVAGGVTLNAAAISAQTNKIGGNGIGLLGADSVAGDVTLNLNGGTTNVGSLIMDVSAGGSSGADTNVVQDNQGIAGDARIDATGGSHNFASIDIRASSASGTGSDGAGNSTRGTVNRSDINVSVTGAGTSVLTTDDLRITATTNGLVAAPAEPTVTIVAQGTGTGGGLLIGDDIVINTQYQAGSQTDTNVAGGVSILADDATISFDRLSATATGGSLFGFGSGQNYQGGEIGLTATNQGTFFGNDVTLTASAVGAAGEGGLGTGGAITITADDGTILVGNRFTASAAGRGGAGGGGTGQGGAVTVNLRGADGSMDIGTLRLNTDGSIASDEEVFFGGNDGDGGSGLAGDVTFNFEGGVFTGGAIDVSADGFGGEGGFLSGPDAAVRGGTGGTAAGGDVVVNLDGSTVSVNSFSVTAAGFGGGGAFGDIDFDELPGDGGDATGGTATFNAAAGSLTVTNSLTVSASATGGRAGSASGYAGGNGGSAVSGDATFNMDGTATVTAGAVTISADATGGNGGRSFSYTDPISGDFVSGEDGGNAGSGTAGNAVFNNTSGDISFTTLTVSADGEGGDGGESRGTGSGEAINDGGLGGAGIGGTATINLNQDDGTDPTYIAHARGIGGVGGSGLGSGAGGSATGGTARLNINNVNVNLTTATIDASAIGGDGGFVDGEGGAGGDGGAAVAGNAILDVNGANAVLTSDAPLALLADGTGGAGSDGGPRAFSAALITPGTGGIGGDGTGGSVDVLARLGATVDVTLDRVNARGTAGSGGNGGSDTVGDLFGDGGAAGNGFGGQINVRSDGGSSITIDGNGATSVFNTSAFGGLGGNAGQGESGEVGAVGSNGDAQGGTVTMLADGAGSTLTFVDALSVQSQGVVQQDIRSDSVGGGNSTGGVISLTATNSALIDADSSILLDASAIGAWGAASGGIATGGSATFQLVGANATLQTLDIIAGATGGNGVGGTGSEGVAGGSAVGGTANVDIDVNSNLDITAIQLSSSAGGGQGGLGADGFAGGAGGAATGGQATVNLAGITTTLSDVTIDAGATAGAGGTGGERGVGGLGGNAQGGTAVIDITGSGAVLPTLADVFSSADAIAGAGGTGGIGDITDPSGTGGSGGTATGGTAAFAISGNGATLDFDPNVFVLSAGANGGTGGNGGINLSGGTAGDGGSGGAATGGAIEVIANSGTTISLVGDASIPFELSSDAAGGAGGQGGDIDMVSGGIAGAGGAGGTGTGGSPTLRAVGGTVQGAEVDLNATGFGGLGGAGGTDGTVAIGAQGNGGNGVGGSPLIEALEGSPGIITLGAVTIDASGVAGGGTVTGSTGGGQITITDASSDPAGLITMSSLTVTAAGAPVAGTPSLTFESDSGPITVTGNVDADVADDIVFDFDGTGQFVVGGNAVLNAGGDIIATHTNNGADLASIDVTGTFTATAVSDFNMGSGSIVDSEQDLTVDADNIIFDRLTNTNGNLTLTAANDVTGVNAINAAPAGSTGLDRTQITAGNDITITGTVQSVDDGVFINADGDIDVNAVSAADNLDVIALGSVTLGTVANDNTSALFTANIRGTSVSATSIDVTGVLNLRATGGSIDVTGDISSGSIADIDATQDFNFGTLDTGFITTVDVGGNVDGGDIATTSSLNLNAIGSVTTGDISADNGATLTAGTNMDVGTVTTTGGVAFIRLNATGALDFDGINGSALVDLDGTAITGGDILARQGLTVDGTTIDVGDVRSTGGFVDLTSTVGNVSAADVTSDQFGVTVISAADVTVGDVNAAGSIAVTAVGDGDIADANAGGSLRLTIGGDLTAGLLDSRVTSPGMTLTVTGDADIEGATASGLLTVNVDGALTGGDFTGGSLVRLTVGSADIDLAESTDQSVTVTANNGDAVLGATASNFGTTVTATGDVSVGNTTSGSFTTLRGDNVTLNSGTVGGNLTLDANDGNVSGTGTVTVGGAINLDATGDIGFGSLAAQGGAFTADAGGTLNFTSASASGALTFDAADIIFDSVTNSNQDLTLTATGNITGNNVTQAAAVGDPGGDDLVISAGGNITITGTASALDDSVFLNADGNIDVGTISAADNIQAIALGAADIDNIISLSTSNLATVRGTSVTIGTANTARGLTLDATAGDIIFTSLTSGSTMNLDATGDILGGNIDTAGLGDVNITALGAVDVDDVTARILTADAGTDLTLGVVDAIGRDIRGIAINLDAGGTISFTSLLSGRGITIGNDPSVDPSAIVGGTITSDNGVNITADAVSVGDVTITELGDITLESEAGNLTTGNLTSHTFGVFLTSSDAVNTGDLMVVGNSNSSDIDVDANGDVTVGDVTAGDRLTMTVGGNLTTGALVSANNSPGMRLIVTGDANIASASDPDGPLAFIIGGALTGGDFTTNGVLNLTAGSIDIDSATANGGIGFVNITTATGNAAVDVISAGNDINVDVGGDFTFVTATAADNIDLVVDGSVLGGDLTTVDDLDINAGNIVIGDASATNIDLNSDTNILFDSLTASNLIALTALSGTIGGNTDDGDIDGESSVTLNATDIDLGIVDAVTSITATATGTASIDNAISGTSVSITGASAVLNSGTIGTDLTLNSTNGDIDGNGAITVGGAIDLDATGDIGFGSLDAQGGNFAADAGGDLSFTSATGSADILFSAVGTIGGGDVTATGAARLNGGNVILGDVSSADIDLTSALDIRFDSLSSPNAISVVALGGTIGANTAGTGDIDSDNDVNLTAAAIAVGDIATGGSLTADAIAGDASFGAVDAVDAVTITATGTPTVASITSGGNVDLTGASVTLSGGDIGGALTLTATAGDVTLALDGTDQILVTGQARLDAAGDIIVTHTNNGADTISLDTTGNILATALGSIDAQDGSILSGNEVFLLANGNIDAADIRAIPGMIIQAGGNVTIADAVASGPQGVSNIRGITVDAGLAPFLGLSVYDNASNATITGDVTSYADVIVRAGGNAVFAAGSTTAANDSILVQTGDDIIVEAGATLASAVNPTAAPDPLDPFNGVGALQLQAGGLANLLSVPLTPIASLVVDGTLNSNTGAIIASAAAIDGLDGTFMGSSIALDINDAPGVGGAQNNDAGLLTANCVEGNICIGNIIGNNVIEIGQGSNNDVIQLFVEQGSVNANEIRITTRDDIVMGTTGIATTLNAATVFSATSTSGDVNLLDAAITSGQILIDAAGSLLGSASLTSANDIGITVGNNLTAGSIDTGGELTQVADIGGAAEGSYSVPGSINIGSLTVGTGDVNYDAGVDLILGTVTVPGTDIILNAGGFASITNSTTANNVTIDAGTIDVGTLTVGDAISLQAVNDVGLGVLNAGGVVTIGAVNVSGSSIDADEVDILATGTVNVGDIVAAGLASIDADTIQSDSIVAEDVVATGNNLNFGIVDGGTVSLSGGTVFVNTGLGGEFNIDGDAVTVVDIDADSVSIFSADTVDVLGSITSQDDIVIDAGGALTGGDFDAGNLLQVDAGTIAIGDAVATTMNLSSNAGTLFNSLTATNAISVTAANGMIGNNGGAGDIDSDSDIDLTAQSIDVGNLTSGGSVTADATVGNAGFGTVDAANDITITAVGSPTVVRVVSGGNTSITGASVILGSGSIGQDLILTATDGDIDVTRGSLFMASGDPLLGGSSLDNYLSAFSGIGDLVFLGDSITVGGEIVLDASDNVNFDSLNAQGGNFTVRAGDNVTFESATSADTVSIVAGGNIIGRGNLFGPAIATRFGSIDATNDVILSAADIDLATINAGGAVSATATGGDISLTLIDAIGLIDLDATGSITVDHAETDDDFVADAIGNFTTGLNTIITGGDIIINADIVDLGNSMAGGLIDVTGSQIDFNAITAGSTISLDTASVTSGNGNGDITGVDITAGPDASSAIAAGSVNITGNSVIGGSLSLDAGANILLGTVVTQVGGVSADANGTITYGSINSADDISMFAGGLISGGDLTAVTDLVLDGGDIAIGDVVADTIDITTGADILFNSLTAPSAITLAALTGTIAANTGAGDIDSGGNVLLRAQTIAIGDISSGGSVSATATAGDASFADIDAAGSVTASAVGTLTADDVTTSDLGASINLSASGAAGDVVTNALTTNGGDILISSSRDISLGTAATSAGTPTAGSIGLLAGRNVTATGLLNAGEDVAIRALGSATLADVQAGDDIAVQADGTIALASANSTGTGVDLFSLSFTPANAGQAGAIAFAAENAALTGSNIQLNGGADITATGTLDAADNIDVTAVGTPTLANVISGGNTGVAGTSVTLNNGTIGGDLTLNATAGDIDGTGTVTVGGGIDFDATGDVGFGDLAAQGGDFTVNAGGDITLSSASASQAIDFIAGGSISATGNITGNQQISLNAGTGSVIGAGLTSDGIIIVDAAGAVDLDDVDGFSIDIDGASVEVGLTNSIGTTELTSGAMGSVTAGVMTAGGDILIDAGTGGFTGTTLDADQAVIIFTEGGAQFTSATGDDFVSVNGTGNVDVTSLNGGNGAVVDVTGTLVADTVSAGPNGVADISAEQGITIDNLSGVVATLTADNGIVNVTTDIDVANLVTATGTSVSLNATGDLQAAADATIGTVNITVGGNLDLQGVTAPGDINITSGGSTQVNGAPVITGTPPQTSAGSGTQQAVSTGGNISFNIGGDLIVNSIVNAANDLLMSVAGVIDLQATASGETINTQSADINIGSTGALGRSDQTDEINIATNGDILLGGAGGAIAGFELDNDEFSRVHSGGDVTISANGFTTGDGDLTVADLSVAVGAGAGTPTDGNIGQDGGLFLSAGNNVEVSGDATISRGNIDNVLAIDAIGDILIDVDTGNLRVEDGNGAVTGFIGLSANSVIAASTAALADITGMSIADIDIRLGQNDGATRDEGYIQGGDVEVNVDNAFFVQNSGAGTDFADRRGLVVDSLTINSASPNVGIVVNGTIGGLNGLAAIPDVMVPSTFDQASTVNGCIIADPASCIINTITPGSGPDDLSDPVQDLIGEELDDGTSMDGIGSMLIEFRKDPERDDDPLIDEPVTGAGNEDLWIGEEALEEDECDLSDEVCLAERELEPAE